MYIIKQNDQTGSVEIKNAAKGVYAKIHLIDGGSLQKLTLDNVPLIVDLEPLTYDTTYASALLFPFANRIKDGRYRFNEREFQLDTNHQDEHNALHGLVYNKTFVVTHQSAQKERAEVIMEYAYEKVEAGFPFPFNIRLKYAFTKTGLDLNVTVVNTSGATFPFTIGWHPYFLSENLNASRLKFESDHQLHIGERNIGTNLEPISPIDSVDLKHKDLDDCWQIKGTDVEFETPNYKLVLSSSQPNDFVQVYTPPKEHIIAIEPTTGVSDSFNNNIGLKLLEPNETFEITWTLKIYSN